MLPSPYIFAFDFGSAGMLYWLAAAATPWLIHLWTRRKYREVPWAAMEYLLTAIQKHSRRLRIEQLILLAIRTAIVILVVLAMSEPYWEDLGVKARVGERAHKLLVIDGSYSMAYKPSEKSRFEQAKELAAQIVGESAQGDGFTLLLMADPPRSIIRSPAFERHDVEQEIRNLKLPQGGGDLAATLLKVEEILAQAKRDQPKLARQEVYFLSDLGRTSWGPEVGGPQAALENRARLKRLQETGAALVVLDLGQANCQNAALTDLRPLDAYATLNRDVAFEVRAKNFGDQPLARQPLSFFVDGQRIKDETLDLPARGEATTSFVHRFDAPGEHTIEARLANDLLELDNHRWLSLPVKPALKVLLVDGASGGSGFRGATDFLRFALDPDAGKESRSPVQTQVASESALSELDLNEFDCLCLNNVAQFTSGEAKLLDRYLRQGGSLMLFLGDRVNADRYNRELGGELGVPRLLPYRLDQPVAKGSFRFDPLDYRHPIISSFRGREDAGLLNTPIYKYFKLRPWEKSAAKVAVAFDSGDPAIVEEAIGRGRVILVALPASMLIDQETNYPWTVWAKWPSFPPMAQDMLAWAVQRQGEDRNAIAGQSISVAAAPPGATTVTLKTPDGRNEQIHCQPDGHWSFNETWQSGIYTAAYSLQGPAAASFAVNVDTAESDLAKVESADLPSGFLIRADWREGESSGKTSITPRNAVREWFLYPLLALVLIETCLAWLFGRWAA